MKRNLTIAVASIALGPAIASARAARTRSTRAI